MKGPSLPEVATAKLREAQRLARLQRSYDAECVASDAKVRETPMVGWEGLVASGFVFFGQLGQIFVVFFESIRC